jgi:hypothetical protein
MCAHCCGKAAIRPSSNGFCMHYHTDGAERFQRIQWVEGDLFEVDALRDAMHGVEHLYHCAALVSFDPRDRPAMMSVNAEGTANVVDAALETAACGACAMLVPRPPSAAAWTAAQVMRRNPSSTEWQLLRVCDQQSEGGVGSPPRNRRRLGRGDGEPLRGAGSGNCQGAAA